MYFLFDKECGLQAIAGARALVVLTLLHLHLQPTDLTFQHYVWVLGVETKKKKEEGIALLVQTGKLTGLSVSGFPRQSKTEGLLILREAKAQKTRWDMPKLKVSSPFAGH